MNVRINNPICFIGLERIADDDLVKLGKNYPEVFFCDKRLRTTDLPLAT